MVQSRVSRKFLPAAQEALHTIAILFVSCGCHPEVNALMKLLRTLFDRPDLASKVRVLRLRTVRKSIAKLYDEQNFDLPALRTRSLSKLRDLGFQKSHPWWRSIENAIESSYAGVLFVLLPNLTSLDFWVKDHPRGPPSGECMSGLFGRFTPPDTVVQQWNSLKLLAIGDVHILKCGLELTSLTNLDLRTVSIGTILRLNGPGCLQGTEKLSELSLTVSVQFADRLLVDKADVQLRDLFDALACNQLSSLTLLLVNDGYQVGDDILTQLDTGYFLDQLCSVQDTLEKLTITLEMMDDESEMDWLLDMWLTPKSSLKHFSSLKHLAMPQVFLYEATAVIGVPSLDSCHPKVSRHVSHV